MGAYALSSVLRHTPANRTLCAHHAGVPAMIALLEQGSKEGKRYAAICIANMTCDNEGNHGLVSTSGGIEALCAVLIEGPEVAQGGAAAAMANLCRQEGAVREEIQTDYPVSLHPVSGLIVKPYTEIHNIYHDNKDVAREAGAIKAVPLFQRRSTPFNAVLALFSRCFHAVFTLFSRCFHAVLGSMPLPRGCYRLQNHKLKRGNQAAGVQRGLCEGHGLPVRR
jgi:hypothetical protein